MKIAALLLLISFFATLVKAEVILLRGIVTSQNSNSKPIKDVEISAFGANTTISNSAGQFELSFSGKSIGTPVELIVQKQGMEVVNRVEIEHVILRKDPDDLLKISMCPTGKWEENAAKFYQIAFKNHSDEVAEIKTEIQKLPANSDTLKKLQKRIIELEQEWYDNQAQIKELTERFASVDLDNVDSLYRVAYNKFTQGDIIGAHQTLNGELLEKNLVAAQAELRVVDSVEKEVEKRKKSARKVVEATIESFILKGNFFVTQMKWNDAEVYYEKAVLADTGNDENVFHFAQFLALQNQHDKAIRWYKVALRVATDSLRNEVKEAAILHNLGVIYNRKNDYPSAEKALKQALEIRERLTISNPQRYEHSLAKTLNSFGHFLCIGKNDYRSAEKVFTRALQIYQRLATTNCQKYQYDRAITLNNLGIILFDDKAEFLLKEALQIYEHLAIANPQAFEPYIASTLNNFGLLYTFKNDTAMARKVYKRALEIYERYVTSNPWAYEPNMASTLYNMAILYDNKNDYPSAEKLLNRALQMYERLATTNPQAYEPYIAKTLINMGLLFKTILEATADPNYRIKGLEVINKSNKILKNCPDVPEIQQCRRQVESLIAYFTKVDIK